MLAWDCWSYVSSLAAGFLLGFTNRGSGRKLASRRAEKTRGFLVHPSQKIKCSIGIFHTLKFFNFSFNTRHFITYINKMKTPLRTKTGLYSYYHSAVSHCLFCQYDFVEDYEVLKMFNFQCKLWTNARGIISILLIHTHTDSHREYSKDRIQGYTANTWVNEISNSFLLDSNPLDLH